MAPRGTGEQGEGIPGDTRSRTPLPTLPCRDLGRHQRTQCQSLGPQNAWITPKYREISGLPLSLDRSARLPRPRSRRRAEGGAYGAVLGCLGCLSRGVASAPGAFWLGSGRAGPGKRRGAGAAMGTNAPPRREPLARGPHVSRGRARGPRAGRGRCGAAPRLSPAGRAGGKAALRRALRRARSWHGGMHQEGTALPARRGCHGRRRLRGHRRTRLSISVSPPGTRDLGPCRLMLWAFRSSRETMLNRLLICALSLCILFSLACP